MNFQGSVLFSILGNKPRKNIICSGPLRAKPGPGRLATKIKTVPPANDKYNGPPKMIERMIRQTTHFVISKSINNQKKANNTLEWVMLTV